jgi:hypothetical protein
VYNGNSLYRTLSNPPIFYQQFPGLITVYRYDRRQTELNPRVQYLILPYMLTLANLLLFLISNGLMSNVAQNSLQKVDLLHIELELRGLNYKTPFYAGCILKD